MPIDPVTPDLAFGMDWLCNKSWFGEGEVGRMENGVVMFLDEVDQDVVDSWRAVRLLDRRSNNSVFISTTDRHPPDRWSA